LCLALLPLRRSSSGHPSFLRRSCRLPFKTVLDLIRADPALAYRAIVPFSSL